jgi:hypothetical protein
LTGQVQGGGAVQGLTVRVRSIVLKGDAMQCYPDAV